MKVLAALVPASLALFPVLAVLGVAERKQDRSLLVPGPTSAGHHQIEEKCETCHTTFSGVRQDACTGCHAAALEAQNDSHAPAKFTDPGRAPMLEHIDARSCVACHREHRPEARARGSVSLPADFCFPCHAEVRTSRESHKDFSTDSCADIGCHNYHDNRALRADLLARESQVPPLRKPGVLPLPSALAAHGPGLAVDDADLPRRLRDPVTVAHATLTWARSSHARGGVNCSECHTTLPSGSPPDDAWRVTPAACGACHRDERAGFEAGKHGMRGAVQLSAMGPARARLPMKPAAHTATLDCNACHRAHEFDRHRAAVEACEGCHDDAHTRAYRSSPHFGLLQSEWSGEAETGSGVSCASCHMPRRVHQREDGALVAAVHNQNDNLRPVDRMARDVCMHCHSLTYALDALADAGLVARNFDSAPQPRTERSPP